MADSGHDLAAHRRDRIGLAPWPTCPRCAWLCVALHQAHGLAAMVPAAVVERAAAYASETQETIGGE